jgi:hypothetical protein
VTTTTSILQPPASSYPRTQTMSLRAALAAALVRHLQELEMPTPSGGVVRFDHVFGSWAEYEDRYSGAAAAVLPGEYTYGDARMSPTLLKETWEPKGQIGWGLYKLADFEGQFRIQLRAPTDAERDVLIAGVEDAWVAREVLMDHADGARYGIVLPLDEYWGVLAEFSLRRGEILDDTNSAMREQNEAILTVSAYAPQVKLAPVRPMRLTVRVLSVG